MSYVRRLTVVVTTDASGDAVAYSDPIQHGILSHIRYVKTDFAAGVDFSIALEVTGETLWAEADVNATATRAPRQATHATTGAAALYAAAGQGVLDKIAIANDRIVITVAQGGATKTGTFHFVLA